MEIDQAKRLLELQACIRHFLELYAQEIEQLPESEEKETFNKRIARVIDVNYTEAVGPIIYQYRNLNPYADKERAAQWWQDTLRKHLKVEIIRQLVQKER